MINLNDIKSKLINRGFNIYTGENRRESGFLFSSYKKMQVSDNKFYMINGQMFDAGKKDEVELWFRLSEGGGLMEDDVLKIPYIGYSIAIIWKDVIVCSFDEMLTEREFMKNVDGIINWMVQTFNSYSNRGMF